MLDLLPVLEGATETSVTSSERFVPGRVESGSARPLTGKSSMLKLKKNICQFVVHMLLYDLQSIH